MLPTKPSYPPGTYTRHRVSSDGDCGYTAFGITREHAAQLLHDNLNDISKTIIPAVREALLTDAFFQNLREQNAIARHITHENVVQRMDNYIRNLTIVQAYINYDVLEKRIDAGFAHPSMIHALAKIQNITLRIWRLNTDNGLIPHQLYDEDYATYTPPDESNDIVDLLYVNNNHFERLTLHEANDASVATVRASTSHHSDIEVPVSSQPEQEFMTAEVVVDHDDDDAALPKPPQYKKILLLGEADFSFAFAYLQKHAEANPSLGSHIVATAYESEEQLRVQYGASFVKHVSYLREQGVKLIFCVDATQLHHHVVLKERRFDAIHFNFPHDGSRYQTGRLKRMLGEFFLSASQLQAEHGKIYMGLPKIPTPSPLKANNYFYKVCSYDIYENTLKASYRLMRVRKFGNERYSGYAHRQTHQNKGAEVAERFPREYVFVKTTLSREQIIHFDLCRAHQPEAYAGQDSKQIRLMRFQLPELSTGGETSEVILDKSLLRFAFPIHDLESACGTAKRMMRLNQELIQQHRRGLPLLQDTIDELIFIFTSVEIWYRQDPWKNIYTHPDGVAWKSHVAHWYYSATCLPLPHDQIAAPLQPKPLQQALTVANLLLPQKWVPADLKESILGSLFYLLPFARERVVQLLLNVINDEEANWRLKVIAASALMRLKDDVEFSTQQLIPALIRNAGYDPRLDWLIYNFLGCFPNQILPFIQNREYHPYFDKINDIRLIFKMLEKTQIPGEALVEERYPSIVFFIIARYCYQLSHSMPLLPTEDYADHVNIRHDQLSIKARRNYHTGELDPVHCALIGDIFLPVTTEFPILQTNLHNCLPSESFYRLGLQYLHGQRGCKKNTVVAANYLKKAALAGYPSALQTMARLVVEHDVDIFGSDVAFLQSNFESADTVEMKLVHGIILMLKNEHDRALHIFTEILQYDESQQAALFYQMLLKCTDLKAMRAALAQLEYPYAVNIMKFLQDNEDILRKQITADNVTSLGQNNYTYLLLGFIFAKCQHTNLAVICFDKIAINVADHELATQWRLLLRGDTQKITGEERVASTYKFIFRVIEDEADYDAHKPELIRKVSQYQGYLVWIAETKKVVYLSAAFQEILIDNDAAAATCTQLQAAMCAGNNEDMYRHLSLLKKEIVNAYHGKDRIHSPRSPFYEEERHQGIEYLGRAPRSAAQPPAVDEDGSDAKDISQAGTDPDSTQSADLHKPACIKRKKSEDRSANADIPSDNDEEAGQPSLNKRARH